MSRTGMLLSVPRGPRASACALALITLLLGSTAAAQDATETRPSRRANTSGGPLLPEQAAYDVRSYDLALDIDPAAKRIDGTLTVTARALAALEVLVLDLDSPLEVKAVRDGDAAATFERDAGRVRIRLAKRRAAGEECVVAVDYGGVPRVAVSPPWQGGFTWSETAAGESWIATSCQGEGGDLWWPCKDHPSDEPEGMTMRFTVPKPLYAASNGRLEKIEDAANDRRTFHWRVSTPINNYAVALCVAPYEVIESGYTSADGTRCPVFFYALPENAKKARKLLPEILDQLQWFEEEFGPYPFRGDKYGVADTPFLGMEHQTLIAYGYGYQKDVWGYDWLHHHELAHEWWGNLVTAPDWNDFWVHEGIGTYCQALYVEKLRGEKAMRSEMAKYRRMIQNRRPLAPRQSKTTTQMYFGEGDSAAHDSDIYFKGAWLIQTLRGLLGREVTRKALRSICYPDAKLEASKDGSACHFVTTDDVCRAFEEASGQKLGWYFDVYARQRALPKLVHQVEDGQLDLRWEVPEDLPFPMPVDVRIEDRVERVPMTGGKARLKVGDAKVDVDPEVWLLRAR